MNSNPTTPTSLWFSSQAYSVLLTLTLCLVFSVAFSGCSREDDILNIVEANVAKTKVDDLSRGMEFVKSDVRFDQKEFREQVTNGLNRWASYSAKELESNSDWSLDKMAAPIVAAYGDVEAAKRISEYQFLSTDPYYIQQAYWITRLLDRLDSLDRLKKFELYRFAADNYRPNEDTENPINEVFKKLQPELSDDDLVSFVRTMKLFDWVCRNVQLESDAPLTDDEKAARILNPDADSAPASGLPGLGYQRHPWQAMMFGRGDYVERAKLMIAGLRYWGIDAVMLATGDNQKPWTVAAVIGGRYYLFDTKLALPIPGKKTGSVATLSDVREDGSLLTQLDLTAKETDLVNTKYWVQPDDVKQLTALVYTAPEELSKRLKGMEDSLVGENRIQLTADLSAIAARLPKAEGVATKAWDIAFKTHQFRQAVRTAFEDSSSETQNRLVWFYLNEEYINRFRPYRTARGRFLIGKFQTKSDEPGLDAIEGWQRLIYDDGQISSLSSDVELQTRHGIRRAKQSKTEFQNEIAAIQGQMRLIRVDAKLFLAQCLFDNANENASGSWLEDLSADEASFRWADSVNYLLGRSFESSGDYDSAIKTLSKDELNQAHGNIIRCRQLKSLIKETYGDDTATE